MNDGATEPPPTGIEAIVCADIARRQRLGLSKYGVSVADNDLSLRSWLEHAYQETLDKAVYLRRAMAEIDKAPAIVGGDPLAVDSACGAEVWPDWRPHRW